jgi:hypothetical protein
VCLGAPLSSRRHEKPVRPAAPYEKFGASALDAPPDRHHSHPFIVIPAQAGIPLSKHRRLDSGVRRNDVSRVLWVVDFHVFAFFIRRFIDAGQGPWQPSPHAPHGVHPSSGHKGLP